MVCCFLPLDPVPKESECRIELLPAPCFGRGVLTRAARCPGRPLRPPRYPPAAIPAPRWEGRSGDAWSTGSASRGIAGLSAPPRGQRRPAVARPYGGRTPALTRGVFQLGSTAKGNFPYLSLGLAGG